MGIRSVPQGKCHEDDCLFFLLTVSIASLHDDPVPLMHWDFNQKFIKQDVLMAQKGPDLQAPTDRA